MSRPTRPGPTHVSVLRGLRAAWLVVLALLLAVAPVTAVADPSPSPVGPRTSAHDRPAAARRNRAARCLDGHRRGARERRPGRQRRAPGQRWSAARHALRHPGRARHGCPPAAPALRPARLGRQGPGRAPRRRRRDAAVAAPRHPRRGRLDADHRRGRGAPRGHRVGHPCRRHDAQHHGAGHRHGGAPRTCRRAWRPGPPSTAWSGRTWTPAASPTTSWPRCRAGSGPAAGWSIVGGSTGTTTLGALPPGSAAVPAGGDRGRPPGGPRRLPGPAARGRGTPPGGRRHPGRGHRAGPYRRPGLRRPTTGRPGRGDAGGHRPVDGLVPRHGRRLGVLEALPAHGRERRRHQSRWCSTTTRRSWHR